MNFPFGMNAIQFGASIAIIVGLVGFVITNWGKVREFFSNFSWGGGRGKTVTPPPLALDQDTLEFQAWNLLRKKKSFQSPEAQAALKVLASHFVEV